jgi:2-dehydro-3-deoxyphosphogluconate aldolase/(4S)-4-hydroxy-2-oxoglutarate aldolase
MILGKSPIIPILVVHDSSWIRDLASSLVACGFPLIEITLRTQQSWDAVEKVKDLPGLDVGVGSVTNVNDLKRAHEIGLKFAVSPGFNDSLLEVAQELDIPYLPGVATPSEMIRAMELGIDLVKWFPAETLGGISALRALSAPFPNLRFIPTGGITRELSANYLRESNVQAIGGSWMFPKELMVNKDLAGLEKCFKEALKGVEK